MMEKIHNEEPDNLYSSTHIWLRRAGHVRSIEEMRKNAQILVGNLKGKKRFGKP